MSGKIVVRALFILRAALVLLLMPVPSFSFGSVKEFNQYSYKWWRTEDGLPQDSVQDVEQTADGYLWLSTESGLARFDGVRFTIFDSSNTAQIKHDGVDRLYASRDGGLWMSAGQGKLVKYKAGEFTEHTVMNRPTSQRLQAIYEDRSGNLWIGMPDAGLMRISNEQRTVYTVTDGLAHNFVTSITEDPHGQLWVGTRAGINLIKDGKITAFNGGGSLLRGAVQTIHADRAGNVWIGLDQNGLLKYRDGTLTDYRAETGQSTIRAICEDRDGNVWFGSESNGLGRFKDGELVFTGAHEGILPDNNVQAICEDREGNIWLGTMRGGLVRVVDRNFTAYGENLPHRTSSVLEEQDGSLWVGTRKGLYRYRDGDVTTFTKKDGLSHDTIKSIYKDEEGNLWVGVRGDGLNLCANGKFKVYGRGEGLKHITSITQGCDGSLWLGSAHGMLTQHKDNQFTTYTVENGLPGPIRMVYRDRGCNVWAATQYGLALFKNKTFTTFTTENGLSSNSILSLFEDSGGNLWLGTHSSGINRFKDGQIKSYTTKDGLPNNTSYLIADDHRGNLWVGTRKGVYRVAKKDFDDYDHGKIKSLSYVSYDKTDGMPSSECSVDAQFMTLNGNRQRLMFPTVRGVAIIDVDKVRANATPPAIVIEEITVDRQRIGQSNGAQEKLPPGRGDVEIRYTGLSFTAPEKMRFKYQLEGFDKEWIDAGQRRTANYTNLPPGNYRFRVLASNNDGGWNEEGTSFAFQLSPHFYQTSWFYLLCAVLVVAFGWWIYYMRMVRMKQQYATVLAERTRIARDLHDSLEQGLAGIAMQLDTASKQVSINPSQAQPYLDLALKLVRRSQEEARRSVWDLRSEALENNDLETALDEIARQVTAGTSVGVQLKVNSSKHQLPSVIERNLLRIGQECVTNAIKHANPSFIYMTLNFDDQSVSLSVRDDGRGFDSQMPLLASAGHFGIIGMRERAKQVGGQIHIRSSANEGTEVIVEVPLNKASE